MKTLLKLSVLCASAVAAMPMTAAAEGVSDANLETTSFFSQRTDTLKRFRLGEREVIFDGSDIHFVKERSDDDDNESDDDANWPKKAWKQYHSHLSGIGFGISGFGSDKFSTNIDDSASYLDLNGSHSLHLDLYLLPVCVRLGDSHFGLCSGLACKNDFYSFSAKNLVLDKTRQGVEHQYDTSYVYKKSKLIVETLSLPVALEWQPRGFSNFYAIVGVEGNLRVSSKTIMKTNNRRKFKNETDLHLNTFGCDVFARMGYNNVGVYAMANLTPLFKKDKGPELYPFSAGLSFSF